MKAPLNASASRRRALAPAVAFLLAAAAPAQEGPPANPLPARTASAVRGVKLYKQGKLDEAARAMRAAVEADKADAESWFHLGVVLNSTGKGKEARMAFEAAVKRHPDHADSHAGLAYTLLVGKKLKEADRSARRSLELAPRGATARYTLGVVRLRQGKAGEAIAEADEALRHSPDFAPAYQLIGQAHVNLYAEESAEALVASVGRKSPASSPTPRSAPAGTATSKRQCGTSRSACRSIQILRDRRRCASNWKPCASTPPRRRTTPSRPRIRPAR